MQRMTSTYILITGLDPAMPDRAGRRGRTATMRSSWSEVSRSVWAFHEAPPLFWTCRYSNHQQALTTPLESETDEVHSSGRIILFQPLGSLCCHVSSTCTPQCARGAPEACRFSSSIQSCVLLKMDALRCTIMYTGHVIERQREVSAVSTHWHGTTRGQR